MSAVHLPAFVAAYSDSGFTNPHEAARPDAPEDRRGQFTHIGARFWGFETARHRGHRVRGTRVRFEPSAHHELVLRLAAPGCVERVEISTAFFTGNQVPSVAIDVRMDDGDWRCVRERTALAPDSDHALDVTPTYAREARIRCYQEGGIARVTLFGTPLQDPSPDPINLLSTATVSHVSNEHYGNPAMAVRGMRNEDHMIGWESARTGFGERALFSLASPARCRHLVVDTYLHRLNPPLSCHLFGLPTGADPDEALARAPRWTARFDDGTQEVPDDFAAWMHGRLADPDGSAFDVELVNPDNGPFIPLLPFGALAPDRWHRFALAEADPMAHLLFMFYPNGGVHGLALEGEPQSSP